MTSETLLEVSDLIRFFGDVRGVDGVSLTVRRGECVGLLGPNGAGKTTTVRVLVGDLAADSGTARAFGLDCAKSRVAIMRKLGFVPDSTRWPRGSTARQVLAFAAWAHGIPRGQVASRVDALLADAGLSQDGDRPGTDYSTGMSKRLAMAMASVAEPDLYILDEPTAGLDPGAQDELEARLHRWRDTGRGILLCTHDLDRAERVCDRVVLVAAGRSLASGTPAELRHRADRPSLREAFLALTGGTAP